jgi:hypothetical protein
MHCSGMEGWSECSEHLMVQVSVEDGSSAEGGAMTASVASVPLREWGAFWRASECEGMVVDALLEERTTSLPQVSKGTLRCMKQ